MHTLAGVLALVFEPNLVRLALLTRRGKMSSEQPAKIRIKCGSKVMRAKQPNKPQAAPPSAGDSDGPTTDSRVAVAGALDVVGRRLASSTRTPPRADARNRRTARRQPGTPSVRRPPRESRRSGTRPTLGPAVNTDYATASTTEPTFTVLAPTVGRPCRASSGYNAQLTNTHDAAADVRHTLTNASDASAMT